MKDETLQPFLSSRRLGPWTNVPLVESKLRGGGAGGATALVLGVTPRLFAARS